jgi:hypothetical protein
MAELKGRNSVNEQVKQSRVSSTIWYLLIGVEMIFSALPDMKQT